MRGKGGPGDLPCTCPLLFLNSDPFQPLPSIAASEGRPLLFFPLPPTLQEKDLSTRRRTSWTTTTTTTSGWVHRRHCHSSSGSSTCSSCLFLSTRRPLSFADDPQIRTPGDTNHDTRTASSYGTGRSSESVVSFLCVSSICIAYSCPVSYFSAVPDGIAPCPLSCLLATTAPRLPKSAGLDFISSLGPRGRNDWAASNESTSRDRPRDTRIILSAQPSPRNDPDSLGAFLPPSRRSEASDLAPILFYLAVPDSFTRQQTRPRSPLPCPASPSHLVQQERPLAPPTNLLWTLPSRPSDNT